MTMTMTTRRMVGALLLAAGSGAGAQTSSVTLCGTMDEYLNYMHSSSGATIKGLEDGAFLRSRLGFRGVEDLGGGLFAKFQLEMGILSLTGAQADSTRGFDRQSWVGLGSERFGEVRFGRQNTAIFYRGDWIDFTSRTLGSIINIFGVPSRYDNDLSYLSPRIGGVMGEVHFAPSETTQGARNQAVYQAALEYLNGPVRVGYAGLRAAAPSGSAYPQRVHYDNASGKIYLAYVRSNNSTASGGIDNAGALVGNTGTLDTGLARMM